MNLTEPTALPLLPLVLDGTPPGLEMILTQEGIPWVTATGPESLSLGFFLLFDSKNPRLGNRLHESVARNRIIDVHALRNQTEGDLFIELLETRPAYRQWACGEYQLAERVSRVDRARLRADLLEQLRRQIEGAGGVWARISAFPYPYRSAFNLRIDLDEPAPEDYHAMARARQPLNDCSTHFVCTSAYARYPDILNDLRYLDTHSHGHHHVVSRSPLQNLRNLRKADELLRAAGIQPAGYAGPEGRWNRGLDQVMNQLGYEFSSEFQTGFDDVPFWPWIGNRFSKVLQIPVHPICEGLFLEAKAGSGHAVSEHLCATIERKVAAFEPAFVYGHPEGRLGRYPEILEQVASVLNGKADIWRTNLSSFARWWKQRSQLQFRVFRPSDGLLEFVLSDSESKGEWIPAIEIQNGNRVAKLRLDQGRLTVSQSALELSTRSPQPSDPISTRIRRPATLRSLLRQALDWETVTPVQELPTNTLSLRARKLLRKFREHRAAFSKAGSR